MTRWLIRFAVVLVLAGAAVGGFLFWTISQLNEPGPAAATTSVLIVHGTPAPAMALQLKDSGVIDTPWLFLLQARLGDHQGLRAGEYAFPAHASLATVLNMMRRGQVVVHKLTIAEGLTVQQIMGELRGADGLSGKISMPPDEGSLMPQTYFYSFSDSREGMVMRMTRAMNETLDELWPKRNQNSPLRNKVEALILASVVERETALPEERPRIAAVFLNRLKLHMRLQSDPTVIYGASQGLGILDHPLTHDELAAKTPYNTYQIDGLPPGPICNPGRAAIAAVLNPADSEDLYFVANGSGGHVFSKSLADHNRNVAKWRSLEKSGKTGH